MPRPLVLKKVELRVRHGYEDRPCGEEISQTLSYEASEKNVKLGDQDLCTLEELRAFITACDQLGGRCH